MSTSSRPSGDDRQHVELLDHKYVSDALNALQWVAERAGRRIPVVIDDASPAASMIAALEAQKCKVIVTTAGGMGRACGAFLDDVMAGRISHSDQPQLNSAVEGARKRPIRDAGLFGWDRRDGTVVVAPLVAVTLAVTAQRPRAAAEAEGPALHSEEDLPGRGLLSLEVRAGWAAQTVSLSDCAPQSGRCGLEY